MELWTYCYHYWLGTLNGLPVAFIITPKTVTMAVAWRYR